MMTTLGYALLALLAREPLTGYDLAQRMRRSTDFFWTARHSQIYPELARMEAAGLLTHEVIRQTERPDKKRYTMTEAGYAALRAWLAQPVRPAPERDEMMLKTFCSWLIEPREAAPIVRAREAEHTARQATYEALLAALEQHPGVHLLRDSATRHPVRAWLCRMVPLDGRDAGVRQRARWRVRCMRLSCATARPPMLYSRCSQHLWHILLIAAAPWWRGRNDQLYDRHLDQPDHQRMSVARGSRRNLAYLSSDAQ